MKKVRLGKYVLEVYDSISELPVLRYQAYSRMLLVDAGVGGDMDSFDAHLQKAMKFIKDSPEKAIKELDNLRQNVYLIQSEITPKHLAFCALVKSVDGVEQTDLSSEGLQRLAAKFGDVSEQELQNNLKEVKKKIEAEMALYFPGFFNDASTKEYHNTLIRRTKLLLEGLVEGNHKEEELSRLEKQLLSYHEPKVFHGRDSEELKFDKNFERMCLGLSENLNNNAKKYTVMEYYSAFEYIQDGRKSDKIQRPNRARR